MITSDQRTGRVCVFAFMLLCMTPLHAQAPLDGAYKGKTSDGRDIVVTVKGAAVTAVKLGFSLKMDKPCVRVGSGPAALLLDVSGGEAETNYAKPLAITKGVFTANPSFGDVDAKLSGTVVRDEIKGDLELQASPGSGCSGRAKLTWSAKRSEEAQVR